ncbi:unnamed protein product, partial [Urochloa humidicola]
PRWPPPVPNPPFRHLHADEPSNRVALLLAFTAPMPLRRPEPDHLWLSGTRSHRGAPRSGCRGPRSMAVGPRAHRRYLHGRHQAPTGDGGGRAAGAHPNHGP